MSRSSAGLAGYAVAVARIHPYELRYFNALAGGPIGGRHILADSNLDWGQGLKSLCRLQREQPEFQDLTLYYFGDTDPAHYGVAGRCHVINAVDDHSHIPGLAAVTTPYVAVSASLQWGPWGPLASSAFSTTSSRSGSPTTRRSRSIGQPTVCAAWAAASPMSRRPSRP